MWIADPGKNLRDYMSYRPKSRRTEKAKNRKSEEPKPKNRTPEAENPGGKPLRACAELNNTHLYLPIPTIKQLRIQKCDPFFKKTTDQCWPEKSTNMRKKKYQTPKVEYLHQKKMISRKNL
jgi:hypothetical protein